MRSLTRLVSAFRFYRQDLVPFLGALALVMLSTAVSAMKPWPIAWILDGVLGQKGFPAWLSPKVTGQSKASVLLALGISIFVLYALQGAFIAGQNYVSIKIGLRGLARVRRELFAKLETMSLRFFQSSTQGDLIYRATWDTYSFQTIFQQGLFSLLTAAASLAIMTVIMWRLNPQLTFIALGTVPLLLLTMLFFVKRMKDTTTQAHQADGDVTSFTQQTLAAMPLIQSYNRQRTEQEAFDQRVEKSLSHRIFQHRWEVLYWLAMALIFGLAAAGLAWIGSIKVLARQLTVGELTVFLAYLAQFYEPLNQLSHVGATLSDASAGTQRVLELLDAKNELLEPARPESILGLPSRLAFENVTFGYSKEHPVLRELSLVVKEGDSIAVIGPSGSGKTTFLQLLPRFYDPDAGHVKLAGIDLRAFSLADLRSQMAIVLQEPILLPGTIRENIAFGNPASTPEEIEQAAGRAHASEFIQRLPKQYDTMMGDGGARLSTGEKQRINLARAFLKNAPILLLDEPTSALDSESEALVMKSLSELMQRRTTIMIAHRLVTLRTVKKIAVLEDGRITQFGSHEELISNKNGYYSRVFSGELAIGK